MGWHALQSRRCFLKSSKKLPWIFFLLDITRAVVFLYVSLVHNDKVLIPFCTMGQCSNMGKFSNMKIIEWWDEWVSSTLPLTVVITDQWVTFQNLGGFMSIWNGIALYYPPPTDATAWHKKNTVWGLSTEMPYLKIVSQEKNFPIP